MTRLETIAPTPQQIQIPPQGNLMINKIRITMKQGLLIGVEKPEEQKTEAGLIIPDGVRKTPHIFARVYKKEQEVSGIDVGDRIILDRLHGTPFYEDSGIEFYLVHKDSIVGVVEE